MQFPSRRVGPSMKKVAILGTRGIPARYGGFETAAEFIASGLQRNGFDVTVACERTDPGLGNHLGSFFEGVKLASFPVEDSLRPLSEILYDIYSILTLGRKSDLVYVFGYGAGFSFWLVRLFGKRLIVNGDGLEWARPKFGRVARFLLRINEFLALTVANVIVADSRRIQEYILGRYRKESVFLPYGCQPITYPKVWDAEALASWDPTVGSRIAPDQYYLILARLEPDNNIAQILEGFSLSRTRRSLLVVGMCESRRYRARIEALAARDPRILVRGPVWDRELKGILRWNCAGYLHGHMVGGTNPSLLEALASGNVILAADVPFNKEVIGDDPRIRAFFFKPTPKDIAATIDDVDPRILEMRDTARVAGPARTHAAYNWDTIIEQYCEVFRGK
jgi:rhamnosyltransferase